jgi:hypothetical protein
MVHFYTWHIFIHGTFYTWHIFIHGTFYTWHILYMTHFIHGTFLYNAHFYTWHILQNNGHKNNISSRSFKFLTKCSSTWRIFNKLKRTSFAVLRCERWQFMFVSAVNEQGYWSIYNSNYGDYQVCFLCTLVGCALCLLSFYDPTRPHYILVSHIVCSEDLAMK